MFYLGLAVNNLSPRNWPAKVHRVSANLAFCDGHVESAKQTNWMAPIESWRRRSNNDNEPHLNLPKFR
ncbi:MAG: hypothetical protein FJ403_02565 [Verrucomicrobia bacterium]|nr:hypothetical protein [Verrucomicrobiota bacterium]